MKAIKGLGLFACVVILISSCFNPPEFSIVPEISLSRITFGETPDVSEPDSITIVLNFKDGDGDLGLSGSVYPEHDTYPFQPYDYFIANAGEIEAIKFETRTITIANKIYELDLLAFENKPGKLVMSNLASDPDYDDNLPSYPNSCVYIPVSIEDLSQMVYVRAEDVSKLQPGTAIISTEQNKDTIPPGYAAVKGDIYRKRNEDHYNISVRMFEQIGANTFQEFSLGNGCEPDFVGRFPVLSTEENSPLEGILSYSLKSTGLKPVMASKLFRFEITIKDRALHETPPLVTRVYTLDELRR